MHNSKQSAKNLPVKSSINPLLGKQRKSIALLIQLNRRIKLLVDVELQPRPLLNGHELIRLGAVSGPSLGRLTEELYIAQLEGHIKTTNHAIDWAKQWLNKHKT